MRQFDNRFSCLFVAWTDTSREADPETIISCTIYYRRFRGEVRDGFKSLDNDEELPFASLEEIDRREGQAASGYSSCD